MLQDFHALILKPPSAWTDLLFCSCFWEFLIHPCEGSWRPMWKVKFHTTLKIDWSKTNKRWTKKSPLSVKLCLFQSTKRFLPRISLNQPSSETLTTPMFHRLLNTRKWVKFKLQIWKSEAFYFSQTNTAEKQTQYKMSQKKETLRHLPNKIFTAVWTCQILLVSMFFLHFERLVSMQCRIILSCKHVKNHRK